MYESGGGSRSDPLPLKLSATRSKDAAGSKLAAGVLPSEMEEGTSFQYTVAACAVQLVRCNIAAERTHTRLAGERGRRGPRQRLGCWCWHQEQQADAGAVRESGWGVRG